MYPDNFGFLFIFCAIIFIVGFRGLFALYVYGHEHRWWGNALEIGQFCTACGCPLKVIWTFNKRDDYDAKTGTASQHEREAIGCSKVRVGGWSFFWDHPWQWTGREQVIEVKGNDCTPE